MMRHFTDDDAKMFMMKYLESDEHGFSDLLSVQYIETVHGVIDGCGGCTLGDGQDCLPPAHYVYEFLVVCKKEVFEKDSFRSDSYFRYSNLSMGWSKGHCSNSLGDSNHVFHYKFKDSRRQTYSYSDAPYPKVGYKKIETPVTIYDLTKINDVIEFIKANTSLLLPDYGKYGLLVKRKHLSNYGTDVYDKNCTYEERYTNKIVKPTGLLSSADKKEVENKMGELFNRETDFKSSYRSDSPIQPPRFVTLTGDDFFSMETLRSL